MASASRQISRRCTWSATTTAHRLRCRAWRARPTADLPVRKGRMALLAYDLQRDGTAKFRSSLVNYNPYDGPDGLTCDRDGNLYVAVRARTVLASASTRLTAKSWPISRLKSPPTSALAAAPKQHALHHRRQEPLPRPVEPTRLRTAGERRVRPSRRFGCHVPRSAWPCLSRLVIWPSAFSGLPI